MTTWKVIKRGLNYSRALARYMHEETVVARGLSKQEADNYMASREDRHFLVSEPEKSV